MNLHSCIIILFIYYLFINYLYLNGILIVIYKPSGITPVVSICTHILCIYLYIYIGIR